MQQWNQPFEHQLKDDAAYTADLETNHGTITIELYPEDAPKAVNNFVSLAREGFYDNTAFHRIVKGFVIQGGDPTGTGTGGPGYKFEDERIVKDYEKGTVAMANAGPNTNGSQFFITEQPTPHLQGRHTVFGQVTKGQDVVHAIATAAKDDQDRPNEEIHIKSIKIEEK